MSVNDVVICYEIGLYTDETELNITYTYIPLYFNLDEINNLIGSGKIINFNIIIFYGVDFINNFSQIKDRYTFDFLKTHDNCSSDYLEYLIQNYYSPIHKIVDNKIAYDHQLTKFEEMNLIQQYYYQNFDFILRANELIANDCMVYTLEKYCVVYYTKNVNHELEYISDSDTYSYPYQCIHLFKCYDLIANCVKKENVFDIEVLKKDLIKTFKQINKNEINNLFERLKNYFHYSINYN